MIRVLKFGGSSVARPDRIRQIGEIIKRYYDQGDRLWIVFSAFGGTTDQLLAMAEKASCGNPSYKEDFDQLKKRHLDALVNLIPASKQGAIFQDITHTLDDLSSLLYGIFLLRECSARSKDLVISFGERCSARIISAYFDSIPLSAHFYDARTLIRTDDQYGRANVDFDTTNTQIQQLNESKPQLVVTTGFIGSSAEGHTTTLGRGGSDYTASILGAALPAGIIEIWTDVNGVLTANPKMVKQTLNIPSLSYAEAMEMSHFGAKVIYPPTVLPALQANIPIAIKNTFNPDFEGTVISAESQPSRGAVKGISSMDKVALLTLQGSGIFGVPGSAARLFSALAAARINVILITQASSEYAISFAVSSAQAIRAKAVVEEAFAIELAKSWIQPIRIERDLSIIAAIGEEMRYRPGIAGKLFTTLGKNGINVVAIAQGSSELNISAVIQQKDEAKALNALHAAFFLSETKTLHLYMAGTGLIGKTLLAQVAQEQEKIKQSQKLQLVLVGLTNSRKMAFDPDGINFTHWESILQESDQAADAAGFMEQMIALNLPNSIFIDNTASKEIPNFYSLLLDHAISISTPNKIAASSDMENYNSMKQLALKRGVQYRYETNVGAGLPILHTLRDLMTSGDQILKIEAVLSGSLSYIFNQFRQGRSFYDAVLEAKQKGLTEPDPREDLFGTDVVRKVLILAREIGLSLNLDDVALRPFLPEACYQADDVDHFLEVLKTTDSHFEQLRAEAKANQQIIALVGRVSEGAGTVGLEYLDKDHPFATLSGSDNMLVITSTRYREQALVIRGPGAGAGVTAAGIFAEIISIGNHL